MGGPPTPDTDPGALATRVQELSERLDAIAGDDVRACVGELLAAMGAVYGDGLERIFTALDEEQVAALAQDGVIASLMLMHGLYPVSLEERVLGALDEVRPYLQSHDGDVEFLGLTDGVLRLALVGSCDGCSASAATLEHAIEEVLAEAAPDLVGLQVEGVAPPRPDAAHPPAGTTWVTLDDADGIDRGRLVVVGRDIVIANVAGTLLAYRDVCAGCGGPLRDGLLIGGTLSCQACARSFDLPRAGRQKGGEGLQLTPVPLLRGGGQTKIALPRLHEDQETCGLCSTGLGTDHRHLLELTERRMICVCETCWSLRSGDPEFRPTGARTMVLQDFTLDDELWAALEIPVGVAFLLRSGGTGGIAALYPSPAGATESVVDPGAWARLVTANPVLERLEPDAEALMIDRLSTPPRVVLAPIDRCYRLVGMIKQHWTGISGGDAIQRALTEFFDELDSGAVAA